MYALLGERLLTDKSAFLFENEADAPDAFITRRLALMWGELLNMLKFSQNRKSTTSGSTTAESNMPWEQVAFISMP